jgi:hypothetical protein
VPVLVLVLVPVLVPVPVLATMMMTPLWYAQCVARSRGIWCSCRRLTRKNGFMEFANFWHKGCWRLVSGLEIAPAPAPAPGRGRGLFFAVFLAPDFLDRGL